MSESIIEAVYSSISEATASIGEKHALRILRGFIKNGREKILKESLAQYYIPPVSMTEDGQFEELRSYAKRSIRYIPDWMSFDEFFDEFEPELKDCYEKAISEHKKQCENS